MRCKWTIDVTQKMFYCDVFICKRKDKYWYVKYGSRDYIWVIVKCDLHILMSNVILTEIVSYINYMLIWDWRFFGRLIIIKQVYILHWFDIRLLRLI